jgi:hypothetical protein
MRRFPGSQPISFTSSALERLENEEYVTAFLLDTRRANKEL